MKKIKMKTDSDFKLKRNIHPLTNSSIMTSNWDLISGLVNHNVISLVDDLIRVSPRELAWSLICDSLYDLQRITK